jgi:hypothetical protein
MKGEAGRRGEGRDSVTVCRDMSSALEEGEAVRQEEEFCVRAAPMTVLRSLLHGGGGCLPHYWGRVGRWQVAWLVAALLSEREEGAGELIHRLLQTVIHSFMQQTYTHSYLHIINAARIFEAWVEMYRVLVELPALVEMVVHFVRISRKTSRHLWYWRN